MAAERFDVRTLFNRPNGGRGRWPHLSKKYKYDKDNAIGKGGFGAVYVGERKFESDTIPKKVALKVLNKKHLKTQDNDLHHFSNEVNLLLNLNHPRIPKLYEIFATKTTIILVQDLLEGGDLFDQLAEREWFDESIAATVIKALLETLDYCHKLDPPVIHRDLKPENIMLKKEGDFSTTMLIDFGLARHVTQDKLAATICGTPHYVPPEVLLPMAGGQSEGYGTGGKSDIWTVGIIAYIFLTGVPPFDDPDTGELFKQIIRADLDIDFDYWNEYISEEGLNFVMWLLEKEEGDRPTAEEALKHEWFTVALDEKAEVAKLPQAKAGIERLNTMRAQTMAKMVKDAGALPNPDEEDDGAD